MISSSNISNNRKKTKILCISRGINKLTILMSKINLMNQISLVNVQLKSSMNLMS